MAKHTQTIRWLLPTKCFSVFDHFVALADELFEFVDHFVGLTHKGLKVTQ